MNLRSPIILQCIVSSNPGKMVRLRLTRLSLFVLLAISSLVTPLQAQWSVEPGTKAHSEMLKFFNEEFGAKKEQGLGCKIEPIRPRVAFSFRFFSGFLASMPAKQFTGKTNTVLLLMRVTPENAGESATPKYFAFSSDLPPIPDNPGKTSFEFSGGFYVGEGKYKVDFAINDTKDRVCKSTWRVTAQDRRIPLQQAPNTVAPLGLEAWKGLNTSASGGRVTVFVHAIPLYYRRAITKLNPFDRITLLGSLTSLLDQSQFSKARIVVFDLLGKRVLFKQDDFDPAGYKRLVNKLETVSYGTIDFKVLQEGPTDMGMIRKLLRDELRETSKSDAIVFLGAEGRPSAKAPLDLREYELPRMFYMGFTRFQIPMEDAMYRVVKSAKGKTITVFRPVDLANGIKSLSQAAQTGNGGTSDK
jgi:hypothetical protein